MPTNVLVVGSGGREHALAWKIQKSSLAGKVYVAPGNGGTSELNVPIKADDIDRLLEFAKKNECFTIVGPEGPLAMGIVDRFREVGMAIVGPTRAEAKLETSKSYAKEFMKRNGIPTADYQVFEDSGPAMEYSARRDGNVVVKADGLAAGKGVVVCSSLGEAEHAIKSMLEGRVFGEAGKKIVIEEKLFGVECSLLALCTGKDSTFFGSAKDHKRLYDNDKGPNTGGMGAFSPTDDLDSQEIQRVMKSIVEPTVRSSGFHGFLYAGLMLTERGIRVLEYNARLGDPETQVILPRLKSDLLEILLKSDSGDPVETDWSNSFACTVVMCSAGYPQSPKIGDEIFGLDDAGRIEDIVIYHSGSVKKDGKYYTNGGRVLSVAGTGGTLDESVERAYSAVSLIHWNGENHRSDIGRQMQYAV